MKTEAMRMGFQRLMIEEHDIGEVQLDVRPIQFCAGLEKRAGLNVVGASLTGPEQQIFQAQQNLAISRDERMSGDGL
ncbi:MAG: hypothetical protein E6471_02690, partial [Bradyrhizobium sp.]|nr:hypothetical protein [Bradyrhizobium sp.]